MVVVANLPKGTLFPLSLIEKRYSDKYGVKQLPLKRFIPAELAFQMLKHSECISYNSFNRFIRFLATSKTLHSMYVDQKHYIHPVILFNFMRGRSSINMVRSKKMTYDA